MLRRTTSNEEGQEKEITEAKRGSKLVFFLSILLIIAIAGFVWSFSSYRQYKQKVVKLSTPEGQQEMAKQEMDALIVKVGKHILLPVDEQPTMATITDPESLAKDQSFYKGVSRGDKVLIYVKAQKAIIYSEANDVLVNVGPVYLENKAPASTEETTKVVPAVPLIIEVRNGSRVTGAAKTLGDTLTQAGYTVSKVASSVKDDYQGVIIVKNTTKDINALVVNLNGKVVNAMPEGESASSAEVIVILGNK